MRIRGFAPIAARGARVLVLGSMPSVRSLAEGQYYGHPRNAFWPIMGALFGAGPELPYDERARRLAAQGVALWDVLAACVRPGSLDADIAPESEVPNDFADFLARHGRIGTVFLNGGKAAQAWARHVLPRVRRARALPSQRLPSTSPANASWSFERKLRAWRAVQRAARPSAHGAERSGGGGPR